MNTLFEKTVVTPMIWALILCFVWFQVTLHLTKTQKLAAACNCILAIMALVFAWHFDQVRAIQAAEKLRLMSLFGWVATIHMGYIAFDNERWRRKKEAYMAEGEESPFGKEVNTSIF